MKYLDEIMPTVIKGDMRIAFMKGNSKRYGIYLFEAKHNWYVKVATFTSDKNADKFMQYITEMFDIEE